MLDLYYQDEKALPANLDALCRKVGARSDEERAAVAFIAGNPDFFQEHDGKLHQPRCEREIERFREKSEKASANGSKGGRRPMFASKVPQGTKADAKPSLSERLPVANQSPSDDKADAKLPPSESLANQEPITKNQEPETNRKAKSKSKSKIKSVAIGVAGAHPPPPENDFLPIENRPPTAETWAAYSREYLRRYGAEPVRNAKVSGQLAQFVKRLGAADAPGVAAFFVGLQNEFYLRKGHDTGSLLADAEKLRTEWATGRSTTAAQARRSDRTASNPFVKILNGSTHEPLAAECENPASLEHRR